jgi:hypothetical protein
MALPSILLLLAFVGGVVADSLRRILRSGPNSSVTRCPPGCRLVGAGCGRRGALAASSIGSVPGADHRRGRSRVGRRHRRRAAGAAVGQTGLAEQIVLGFILLLGVGVFLYAMRWDSSDPARVTRRSDVAFWLHLLAAPMIVHPVFTLLGLNDGDATLRRGPDVVAIYVALGIAALAIDSPCPCWSRRWPTCSTP